jgi:hypothetical protein
MVALGLGGLGVLGIGVGSAVALAARSSYQDAAGRCPNRVCTDIADKNQADDARTRGNIATAIWIGGVTAFFDGRLPGSRDGRLPSDALGDVLDQQGHTERVEAMLPLVVHLAAIPFTVDSQGVGVVLTQVDRMGEGRVEEDAVASRLYASAPPSESLRISLAGCLSKWHVGYGCATMFWRWHILEQST